MAGGWVDRMWRRREGRENILTPERAFSLTGARAVAVEQARTLQKVALTRPPSLSLSFHVVSSVTILCIPDCYDLRKQLSGSAQGARCSGELRYQSKAFLPPTCTKPAALFVRPNAG